jgi:hypothetical protein
MRPFEREQQPANERAFLRPPAAGVARNPLIGLTAADMRPMPVGVTIASLQPEATGLLVCRLNGEPLSRLTRSQRAQHARLLRAKRTTDAERYFARSAKRALNWRRTLTRPGDVIEWIDQPQDKNILRTALTIAAVVYLGPGAFGISGLGLTGVALAGAAFGASLLINALLPPSLPSIGNQQQPRDVFSTSLSGNVAKIDSPIWKVCGRRKLTPPFAGDPYFEFSDDDGDDLDNKQYLFALYAIGVGNHTLEQSKLGGALISHLQDVVKAEYLPPGTQPNKVLKNVSTSTIVNGQVLDTGFYVGGFPSCEPKRTSAAIGIDIIATRGLGKAGGSLTVAWRVEARQINDFDTPLSGWSVIGTGTKTAATNTPQRWSQKIAIGIPARFEIRVVRTDNKDTDSNALHEIAWGGLRSYNAEIVNLNGDTAHFELVLRASEQLSNLSQRDLSLTLTAHARAWDPSAGWQTEGPTRTPAWWLLDLASNPVWGLGLPDDRIDLQSFRDFGVTNEARQDRFDWVFDTAVDAWSAMQLIARTGRGRVFRRNGLLTIARDQLDELPVTAFTPRNTLPGSMSIGEALPTREMADGFVIEYEDLRTWLWTPIKCPCPGVTTMRNPVHKRIEGITGSIHAEREGRYEAANLLYRNRKAACRVEMQGELPAYLSTIRWLPEIQGYGASGDVAFWDPDTLVMGLTEPVTWGAGGLYLTLIRDDGSLTTPVLVTPGPTQWDVLLPALPNYTLIVDSGERERPKYLLGPLDTGDELVKVSAIKDGSRGQGGERYIDIESVPDDARVHSADNPLLPSPGEIQDPIDSGLPDEDGTSSLVLVMLSDHFITSRAAWLSDFSAVTGQSTFTLTNDGHASGTALHTTDGGAGDGMTTNYPNEWMQFGTVEPATAALFEVRATYIGGDAATTGGDALNSWLSLGTTRSWTRWSARRWTSRSTRQPSCASRSARRRAESCNRPTTSRWPSRMRRLATCLDREK